MPIIRPRGIPGWRFEHRKDPTFAFGEEPHEYHLKDLRLWSPTSVMKQVGYVNTDYYTDEHRYRGNYVHWIRRLYDEKDLDIKDVAPEYQGFLDGYKSFNETWNFRVRMSERPIYHKLLHYGVTADAEGIILRGDPAVVEFKSGEPKSGPPLWWTAIQTAAQHMAIKSWDMREIHRRRIGVKLFRNGKFKAVEYDDEQDFAVWAACLKVCQRLGEPPRKTI